MDKIKIRTRTMLGTSHSWAVTMRSLFLQFSKMSNVECYMSSTNRYELFPEELRPSIRNCSDADIDICYTLPRNFRSRFRKDSKVKMAIYNYETDILPEKWVDKIQHLDYVLPSSNFSKEVFVKSGWPEEKCVVVPHGINIAEFDNKHNHNLVNDKSFRFLNVSIPHYRKNIDLLVDAYYNAFSEDDDVCLVIKSSFRPPKGRERYRFECDVIQQIKEVQAKYIKLGKTNLPKLELMEEHLESIIPLYNACDVLVSASSSEGFGLPLLEALAADMLVVAPACTGQLDFLSDKNSLLVDTKVISAGSKYQYWRPSVGATTYLPHRDALSEQMLNAYKNKEILKEQFNKERLRTINKFTWENAAKQILEII